MAALLMDPWKLSMKAFLRSFQMKIEFGCRLSSHMSGAGSRAIGKYRTLVTVSPPATSIAVEYNCSHCIGSCLPSYFWRLTCLKSFGFSASAESLLRAGN